MLLFAGLSQYTNKPVSPDHNSYSKNLNQKENPNKTNQSETGK